MNRIDLFRSSGMITACLVYLVATGCGGDDMPPAPGGDSGFLDVNKIARWDGAEWHALGQGVNNAQDDLFGAAVVNDIAIDGNLVYAGGLFQNATGTRVNSVARWGDSWQGFGLLELPGVLGELGELGATPGTVNAMVISQAVDFGKTLFVGGSFTTVVNDLVEGILGANYIAQFYLEVGVWDELPQGVDGTVNALDVGNLGLFVGGEFASAYDQRGDPVANTNLIARWSIANTVWASVGGGITGTAVNALAVAANGSDVYVGGDFSMAGSVPAFNIARWTGSQWQSLGDGLRGPVYDLAMVGSDVYAAGQLFTEGFESFYLLAKWDGNTWTFMGDEIVPAGQEENYQIRGLSLAISGNDIYLGGRFENMAGLTVNHVARFDGTTWTGLTGGVHNIGNDMLSGVKAIAISGSDVYVGGTFTEAGE